MKNKQAKWWNEAKSYLMLNDPIMKKIIINNNKGLLQSRGEPYNALCRTIIGQQISVKAAASIWNKFQAGVKKIIPINIINFGNTNLRSFGLSNKKVEYIFFMLEVCFYICIC